MISSAVVIPEEAPPTRSPSSLKRRQSSTSEDTNKRPRIAQRSSHDNGSPVDQSAVIEPATSPVRRKSTTVGSGAEERKRGQRLFGALLGTLSQTSSKPVHRKRDEIEQKQRERLRKDNQERDEERRRKRAELHKIRRVEQQAWNEEGARLRHRNMRAMANFLQTKSEPRLYFRPWELRPEEEEQIKRQIADVEAGIDQERHRERGIKPDGTSARNDTGEAATSDAVYPPQQDTDTMQPRTSNEQHEPEPETSLTTANAEGEQTEHAQAQEPTDEAFKSRHDHNKDDDHGGGELVEGQEDDIMY